jgi:hypothetical protein
VNALANEQVGKYMSEYFCTAFQRVGTFVIVQTPNGPKQKQGGNVATYFCAPDGRVLHTVAGPVDANTFLKEAKWVVDTAFKAMKEAKDDGGRFKAIFRKAHADRLRTEHGLAVEPVLFETVEEPDPNSALTYRDPTGRPLAPKLPPPPIDGPDVKFRYLQENFARTAPAGASLVMDRRGGRWVLGNQGKAHHLMSAHCMVKIENIYGAVFEGILGERITTRPVETVTPFNGHGRRGAN